MAQKDLQIIGALLLTATSYCTLVKTEYLSQNESL